MNPANPSFRCPDCRHTDDIPLSQTGVVIWTPWLKCSVCNRGDVPQRFAWTRDYEIDWTWKTDFERFAEQYAG